MKAQKVVHTLTGCAAVVALAFASTGVAQAKDIRFGFAAPLTGPQSHYGEDMQNGLTLALEEANKRGIVVDGEPARFVLVSKDDQADPRVAVQVAQQLVDDNVAGILGHFNSGTTIPASRIYHDAGLPQIAMATAAEYTQQNYETTFRMMTSDTQQGSAVGKFMVDNLKAKKIALIDDRSSYGQGLTDRVEQAVKAAGGTIVRREYTTDKANDFTSILTNIKAAAPDAIFFGGLDAQSGPMKRQIATLGISAPLVSGEMTRSDTFIKLAGDAANGTYASLAGVPISDMAAGKTFEQAYAARFNKAPGVYAPYAYDGAWNLVTAIEKAKTANPEKYLPELAKLSRSGATSEHIAYDDKGDLNEVAVTVYEVKNGKWEMVHTMVSNGK